MLQHDAWIGANQITDARVALVCARLSLRGGKRRLQKGYSAGAMLALYDAVLFGMHYYLARHERCVSFVKDVESWDVAGLFHALARAGVFDDPLAIHRITLIVERVLWEGSISLDAGAALAEVETLLMKLGVIPVRGSPTPGEARLPH